MFFSRFSRFPHFLGSVCADCLGEELTKRDKAGDIRSTSMFPQHTVFSVVEAEQKGQRER